MRKLRLVTISYDTTALMASGIKSYYSEAYKEGKNIYYDAKKDSNLDVRISGGCEGVARFYEGPLNVMRGYDKSIHVNEEINKIYRSCLRGAKDAS